MKTKLLIVSPGPKMGLDEDYYLKFSKIFEGAIVTTSSIDEIRSRKAVYGFEFYCGRFIHHSRLFSNLLFSIQCFMLAVRKRLSKEKYDLVVVYDPIKTGVLGLMMSKIIGCKLVVEVNGVYTSEAEYLDGGDSFISKIKKWLIPKIIRLVLKNAAGIKLLFDDQIQPFESEIKGTVIDRFPCYVNTRMFKGLGEENVVLFAGFPFKRKGVDILIPAFKQIAGKYPEWRLKILGWFPDKSEIDSAIGGHEQIFHHPPVFYKEMPEQVGKCSFVVLPSRSEAMGRILVEAMACGKPRVGSNVDGIPTVINDGVDGLLVSPGSVAELANALELLIKNVELRNRLGNAAEERARTEFTDQVFFDNTKSFYSRVIAS